MTSSHAHDLIHEYVDAWKAGDAARVVRVLTPDCEVIESHGPTFTGRDDVRSWIEDWNQRSSAVIRWDLHEIVHGGARASVEWRFECVDRQTHYLIDGISMFEFCDGLIAKIREYRRTEIPYPGLQKK
jgi:ketosteroid isomerase-like protein